MLKLVDEEVSPYVVEAEPSTRPFANSLGSSRTLISAEVDDLKS
jgi:hypothetical protein